jgi:hypothetical protein
MGLAFGGALNVHAIAARNAAAEINRTARFREASM